RRALEVGASRIHVRVRLEPERFVAAFVDDLIVLVASVLPRAAAEVLLRELVKAGHALLVALCGERLFSDRGVFFFDRFVPGRVRFALLLRPWTSDPFRAD